MGQTMKLTHTFKLDGEEVTGRCTFRAINAFDETAGMSIPDAWKALSKGSLSFSVLTRAVWAFINGERLYNGQREEPFDVIGAKMHKEGFNNFIGVASQFFLMSVPDPKGSSDEVDEKKS